VKLGDFCCLIYVNTQNNQGDDSDMLKDRKKKIASLSFLPQLFMHLNMFVPYGLESHLRWLNTL